MQHGRADATHPRRHFLLARAAAIVAGGFLYPLRCSTCKLPLVLLLVFPACSRKTLSIARRPPTHLLYL